jgi:hypothetical protein
LPLASPLQLLRDINNLRIGAELKRYSRIFCYITSKLKSIVPAQPEHLRKLICRHFKARSRRQDGGAASRIATNTGALHDSVTSARDEGAG